MRTLQNSEGFSEAKIGQWMDIFLLSRIGTEMLTSQYMACANPPPSPPGRPSKGRIGIVDDATDPAMICDQAAKHARKLVRNHFNIAQDVQIVVETSGRIRFP